MEPLLSMSNALNKKCAYVVASENTYEGLAVNMNWALFHFNIYFSYLLIFMFSFSSIEDEFKMNK